MPVIRLPAHRTGQVRLGTWRDASSPFDPKHMAAPMDILRFSGIFSDDGITRFEPGGEIVQYRGEGVVAGASFSIPAATRFDQIYGLPPASTSWAQLTLSFPGGITAVALRIPGSAAWANGCINFVPALVPYIVVPAGGTITVAGSYNLSPTHWTLTGRRI